jgi:predicted DNA-binding transcriptional regulator AlpA
MRYLDKYCKIWREFQTDEIPSHLVVWPDSESKEWCDRLTAQLNHNNVS